MSNTILGGGSPLNKLNKIADVLATDNQYHDYYIDPVDGVDSHDGKSPLKAFKTFNEASMLGGQHTNINFILCGDTDYVLTVDIVFSAVNFRVSTNQGASARLIFDGGIIQGINGLVEIQCDSLMRSSQYAISSRARGMVILSNHQLVIEAGSAAKAVVLSPYGNNQVFLYRQSFTSHAGLLPVVAHSEDADTYVTSVSATLTNMTEI